MDCGCYRNGENYVVRVKGSEYTCDKEELHEFIMCLTAVEAFAEEAMSLDYQSLPEPCAPTGKGLSLASLFGFTKKTLGIRRRV